MSELYSLDTCCKDSHQNTNALKAVANGSSAGSKQITPTPLTYRAAGPALIAAGCAVVALAVALNVRPLLADGITAPALLDAAPLAVATLAFAGSPSATAWLWRAGHRWAAAFALALALGCGVVSVSNIIGSQYGRRLTTAAEAGDADTTRAEARRQIERDTAELATLGAAPAAPARSPDALAAEIAAKLTSRRDLGEDCEGRWLPSPGARGVCIEVAQLRAEQAEALATISRAQRWTDRRAKLEARIAATRVIVDGTGSKVANADAAAIVALAQRLGWRWSIDGVNLGKSVLISVMIEGAAALLFLLAGVAFTGPSICITPARAAPAPFALNAADDTRSPSVQPGYMPPTLGEHCAGLLPPATPKTPMPGGVHRGEHSARQRVIDRLQANAGAVRSSQRALAAEVGVSPARLNTVLRDLAAEGLVNVRTGATGTVITLN